MPTVEQMSKRLDRPPHVLQVPGATVRHYAGRDDIARWLELRHRAFARQRVGVRQWTEEDFAAEFLAKSWWRPEWMWLAEAAPGQPTAPLLLGAVTLAIRGEGAKARPAVH